MNTPSLEKLAKFVAETSFSPDEKTVILIRNALIDTLGCIIVGAQQPVAQRTQQTLASWGHGTAPLYGSG